MIKTSFTMFVLGCLIFTSCSDDDEPNPEENNETIVVNPSNVFTGGLPKSVAGISITCNADGLVTSMNGEDGQKITFEYSTGARAESLQNHVKMTVIDEEETYIIDMELNKQGFVEHCKQTYSDGDTDTWDFKYNADGQLNYMKRSEGGNEITILTYQNGDIVKTTMTSDEEPDEKSEYTISYTSATVTTPIENKGCLMLFDATLGVDMDEMDYAYYAGLLGKATKHLPTSNVDSDGYKSQFTWKLNDKGYPTKLTTSKEYYEESYSFNW